MPPAGSVTREEALQISRAYSQMKWKPGKKNILHGEDPWGIRVDTPDSKERIEGTNYWVPDQWNTGMPYKWGGFDTPREFMVKIQSSWHPFLARNPAGDIATDEKIRLGDDAVSTCASGIDCSGFVSRCWRLPKSCSTRELPLICQRLKSYSDLKTGDILILPGVHVTMFLSWADDRKTKFTGSEAAGNGYWSVVEMTYPTARFKDNGFVPMRYVNMK